MVRLIVSRTLDILPNVYHSFMLISILTNEILFGFFTGFNVCHDRSAVHLVHQNPIFTCSQKAFGLFLDLLRACHVVDEKAFI